jgi:iron complex outermembrane recepter protein
MKKQLALLALFVCMHLASFSQYSVSGTVKDESGNALQGANVKLEPPSYGSETDPQGAFVINNLKAGDYSLQVSYLGFETETLPLQVKGNVSLNVVLKNKQYLADDVIVRATRASENSPITKSTISREEIGRQNLGQDVPYLLDQTPSMVTTSDAGTGVGYTYFKIRGTDINRINVTMNGIPLNDAESYGVWWVDMPDIASSVDNIQVQRGVGTSTLGGGAFGASINLQTMGLHKIPYVEINNSFGSFNTMKNSVSLGTGLLNDHFAFDGRLSRVTSDGYIDRASSKLKSFFVSGAYYSGKSLLRLNISSGQEQTYQAWGGVPSDSLATNRTYNSMGQYTDAQGNIQYYKNQTDNYQQDHYQLLFSHSFTNALNLNAALHFSTGKGYYEEYKEGQSFGDYLLSDVVIGGDTLTSTNLIRRKWLDNAFYGFTWSLNYVTDRLHTTVGGGVNQYYGKHYGNVIWAQYMSDGELDHQYYYNTGTKNDYNIFAKSTYLITDAFSVFGDLQFRGISHSLVGEDDGHFRDITQKHHFFFVNPKLGATITITKSNSVYAYFGVANREPSRDNFVDADPSKPMPTSERLLDYEFGFNHKDPVVSFGANIYYMRYKNQLVLTGDINDVGSAVMTNVANSYRTGIELTAGIKPVEKLSWDVNATFSRNIIQKFTSYVDNWDYWSDPSQPAQYTQYLGDTKIAFSPEVIVGSQLSYQVVPNLYATLVSKYVGKQYIDNTQSEAYKLKPYFVNNLRFNYHIKAVHFGTIEAIFAVNNIFATKYESNAWVYQYVESGQYKAQDGYFPQAGINYMAGLVLKF